MYMVINSKKKVKGLKFMKKILQIPDCRFPEMDIIETEEMYEEVIQQIKLSREDQALFDKINGIEEK